MRLNLIALAFGLLAISGCDADLRTNSFASQPFDVVTEPTSDSAENSENPESIDTALNADDVVNERDDLQDSVIVPTEPPFWGTVYLSADLITADDPTAYVGLIANGQGSRKMYDRRVSDWTTVNAYLFNATYTEGFLVEVQVNAEFGSVAAAQVQAEKYAKVVGQLPTGLRSNLQTMWIHAGHGSFGGGNQNILIHVDRAAEHEAEGTLEEALIHEGSHTSLDPVYRDAETWLAAQVSDVNFISKYAADNSTREDIAESYLTYFAIRFKADRISSEVKATIDKTIPNRILFFDALALDMYPVQ